MKGRPNREVWARRCPGAGELARYVDGGFDPAEAYALEAHAAVCARCRQAVEELSRITRDLAADPLDPVIGALPDLAPLVMARAELPPPRRIWWRQAAAGLSLAAALCVGVLVERQRAALAGGAGDSGSAAIAVASAQAAAEGESGFQARGGSTSEAAEADRWTRLRLFAANGSAAPRALFEGDTIDGCHTKLLFAYDNGGAAPFAHVAIVGAWDGGRAEWFFPDGTGIAGTIAAATGVGRELHEEVGLDGVGPGAPRRLRIWTVFSRTPIERAVVERAIAARGLDHALMGSERLALPGTGQHAVELRVEGCAAQ